MNGAFKLLILGMIFCFSNLALADDAKVETIGGATQIAVKRGGQEVMLKAGDALKIGDEVITNKTTVVDVRLQDKTLIRVGANTSYRLEEDSSKHFLHRLLTGIVRVLVPPAKDATYSRFRMNTPEGTIGVRGTEFVVERGKDETTLRGLEGTVMFGPADANFSDPSTYKLVNRGFMSTVRKGGKPGEPANFPLSKYLKEIDAKSGVFGALAENRGVKVHARQAVGGASEAPVKKAAAPAMVPKSKAVGNQAKAQKQDKPMTDDEALYFAAAVGDIEKAKQWLKKGADINTRQEQGARPLHAAVVNEKNDMVTFLLENGADVNAKNNVGDTPLMMVALETGSPETALILIEAYKADVTAKDKAGFDALDIAKYQLEKAKDDAAKKRYEELVKLLSEEAK